MASVTKPKSVQAFKRAGLIGKYDDPGVGGALKKLGDYLRQRCIEVLLDEGTAQLLPGHGLATGSRDEIGRRCDLAIVVGGDGTLLNAARSLVGHGIPLLGVNLGRLGFLVDISSQEMTQRIDDILAGHYLEEQRLLLHAAVEQGGAAVSASDAFNDVVLHKWDVARMIEFDVHINGQFVNTYRSDGMIVSTPTGSTAYALSSHGPILHPTLDALALVPICPHTMSNRPIVVEGGSRVEIKVDEASAKNARITCDGQISLGLAPGARVVIGKKDQCVRLIHPANYDYYQMLRAKLHWGENF
jgi:NAD+ kinase